MTEQATRQAIDAPWPLPAGWCWVRVGDVVAPVSTVDPRRMLSGHLIRYIDLSALGAGRIETSSVLDGAHAPTRARQIIRTGDTLFSCVRVYLRNIALVSSEFDNSIASTAYCVLRPKNGIDGRYLNYYVQSQGFINRLIPLQRGNSPPAVVDSDIKGEFLPLAPLPEQKRIVARIDALFAEIAAGEAALEEARTGLETFRRALLKAAVSGDLTAGWRADRARAGKPVGETGADLLARIRAERANAAPRKTRGRRQPAAPADLSALPDLPKGWVWATLGEVLSDIEAGLNVRAHGRPPEDGEIGILKISSVTWGEFRQEESKALFSGTQIDDENFVSVGDFLFSRANTIELVGAPAIVRQLTKQLVLSDKVLRFRICGHLDSWVEICLKSPHGRHEIQERATGAQLSMRNISQDSIRALPIPLPPPEEMTEILSRVTAALEATAETRALLETEAADAARLRQSVLKAAFEGRLVPQDPADEPAAALLARTRSTAPPAPRRGRRKAP